MNELSVREMRELNMKISELKRSNIHIIGVPEYVSQLSITVTKYLN